MGEICLTVRTCFVSDLQRGEKIQAAKFNIDGKAEVSSIDIGLLLSLILRNSEKNVTLIPYMSVTGSAIRKETARRIELRLQRKWRLKLYTGHSKVD